MQTPIKSVPRYHVATINQCFDCKNTLFFIIQPFFDNFLFKKSCKHSHAHRSPLTDNLRFAISVGAYQTRTMHAHTYSCVLEMYILSLHCVRNARHLNNPAQGARRSVGLTAAYACKRAERTQLSYVGNSQSTSRFIRRETDAHKNASNIFFTINS